MGNITLICRFCVKGKPLLNEHRLVSFLLAIQFIWCREIWQIVENQVSIEEELAVIHDGRWWWVVIGTQKHKFPHFWIRFFIKNKIPTASFHFYFVFLFILQSPTFKSQYKSTDANSLCERARRWRMQEDLIRGEDLVLWNLKSEMLRIASDHLKLDLKTDRIVRRTNGNRLRICCYLILISANEMKYLRVVRNQYNCIIALTSIVL